MRCYYNICNYGENYLHEIEGGHFGKDITARSQRREDFYFIKIVLLIWRKFPAVITQ
jgi:hypothetical protein